VTIPYRNQRIILANPPIATQDYNRKSITLNGTDEFFNGYGDIFNFALTDTFAFSFWAKKSTGGGIVAGRFSNAATFGRGWDIAIFSNLFRWRWQYNAAANVDQMEVVANGTTVMNGNWHHIGIVKNAGVGNASEIALYFDGLPTTPTISVNTLHTNIPAGIDFEFARRIWDGTGGGSNFLGQLDEFCVWSQALTAAQMSRVYRTRDPRLLPFSSSLELYHSGDGSDGTILPDYSVNGRNGTPQNMDASNYTTDVYTPT